MLFVFRWILNKVQYNNFSNNFLGLIPHSNHASAAVMIVNPTTPNTVTGNVSQPFNVSIISITKKLLLI